MKNKVLVEVYLPATEETMEIRVPRQIRIERMVEMLKGYFHIKNYGYLPMEDAVLCDSKSGKILNQNAYVEEVGLRDGSRVIMI